MATTIPLGAPVTLQAQVAGDEWPGPPSWTPSDPSNATISLIEGTGQFQAMLDTLAPTPSGSPLTVTVLCGQLQGSIDLDVQQDAGDPGVLTITVA